MSTVDVQLVDLPSHFLQVQLAGMKTIVDQHIQDGNPVQFDASQIERIDGAAVQFLLAVSDSQGAVLADSPLVINSNDVLTNALNDMGVAEFISTQSENTISPETK